MLVKFFRGTDKPENQISHLDSAVARNFEEVVRRTWRSPEEASETGGRGAGETKGRSVREEGIEIPSAKVQVKHGSRLEDAGVRSSTPYRSVYGD